jgi:hypothetical protein
MTLGPYSYDDIFSALVKHCADNLPEYRKKQLAAVMIHQTLTDLGSKEIISLLKQEVAA